MESEDLICTRCGEEVTFKYELTEVNRAEISTRTFNRNKPHTSVKSEEILCRTCMLDFYGHFGVALLRWKTHPPSSSSSARTKKVGKK